jgi:hypothetical protein
LFTDRRVQEIQTSSSSRPLEYLIVIKLWMTLSRPLSFGAYPRSIQTMSLPPKLNPFLAKFSSKKMAVRFINSSLNDLTNVQLDL